MLLSLLLLILALGGLQVYAIKPDALAIATIWQEARGESYIGKLAVAQVIRNRMARKYSSDGTVFGTVLRPYQFSGWNTEASNRIEATSLDTEDPVYMECRQAWINSHPSIMVGFPAVLYHAKTMREYPQWASAPSVVKVAEIGNHIFYDER